MRCFGPICSLCMEPATFVILFIHLNFKTVLDRSTASPHKMLFQLPILGRSCGAILILFFFNQVVRASLDCHSELRRPHSLFFNQAARARLCPLPEPKNFKIITIFIETSYISHYFIIIGEALKLTQSILITLYGWIS